MATTAEELRASTCGFLQHWVLPGMRAGSSGTGWRQVAAHGYGGTIVKSQAPRLQDGNRFASHIVGLSNVKGS